MPKCHSPRFDCYLAGAAPHAEHLDDDALAALAVELGIEDALPGAEVEMAAGDGQGGLVVEQQGLEVGVGVVLPVWWWR